MKFVAIALLALVGSAAAANLDGKWTVEVVAPVAKKAPAKKAAAGVITLDLKSAGAALSGSVTPRGKKAMPMSIQDGKIDGDHFTFSTVQHGKKGDVKFNWQGTVSGEQITGTRSRDGAKRGAPFTAKRAS
jgi:hypothetical protein